MVTKTISMPEEMIQKLKDKNISLSRIAQDAAKIALLEYRPKEAERLKRQLIQQTYIIEKEIETLQNTKKMILDSIEAIKEKEGRKK